MSKITVKDIEVRGKTVLVRCDFNVPYDENRVITDNRRIVEALPTIKHLLENGCKVVLCSHLGKPKGQENPKYSLDIVAEELSKLLGMEVPLTKDVFGEDTKNKVANLAPGQVMLVENTRFHEAEEKKPGDPLFEEHAKNVASMADAFIFDAFGTAHRAHVSTAGVAKYMKEAGKDVATGLLVEKELDFLGTKLDNPERPFVAILGGKKVSDKIGVIESLMNKADVIMIGGAMANTFIKAAGHNIGDSVYEEDKLNLALELIEKAKEKGVKLMLPSDLKLGKEFDPNTESQTVKYNEIPDGWQAFDIGEDTIRRYEKELQKAKTVFWNGPAGLFEFEQFAGGTNGIAQALANLDATTIIGGGDSAAAIEKAGLSDQVTFISTGGGASLEFIEGKPFPVLEYIDDKENTKDKEFPNVNSQDGNSAKKKSRSLEDDDDDAR